MIQFKFQLKIDFTGRDDFTWQKMCKKMFAVGDAALVPITHPPSNKKKQIDNQSRR